MASNRRQLFVRPDILPWLSVSLILFQYLLCKVTRARNLYRTAVCVSKSAFAALNPGGMIWTITISIIQPMAQRLGSLDTLCPRMCVPAAQTAPRQERCQALPLRLRRALASRRFPHKHPQPAWVCAAPPARAAPWALQGLAANEDCRGLRETADHAANPASAVLSASAVLPARWVL